MKKTFQKSLLTVLITLLFLVSYEKFSIRDFSSLLGLGFAMAEAVKENRGLCIIRISNKKDADLRACAVHGQTPEGQACHKKATDEYDAALAECHKLPSSSF